MARRASSKIHPSIFIAAAVCLVLLIAGGRFLLSGKNESFSGEKLDVSQILEGSNLAGNEYVVSGEVDEKLQTTAARGQLVSLRIATSSGDEFLGIEIPPGLTKTNISTKQKYLFRVKFRQGSIAVATGVKRL